MPKPKKIKKAKSFMFTTKHHSFSGVLGIVIGVISAIVMSFGIFLAYTNKGASNVVMGSVSLFALILNVVGIVAGTTALAERDIHKWVPIASILFNSVILAAWVILIMWGSISK